MSNIGELVKKPSFILKLLELVLAVICLALLQDLGQGLLLFLTRNLHQWALVHMVFCGYLLILPMQILGKLMGEETPKNVAFLWAFVGATLWIAAGGCMLEMYYSSDLPGLTLPKPYPDQYLSSAIIGIINGCFFIVELITVLKSE